MVRDYYSSLQQMVIGIRRTMTFASWTLVGEWKCRNNNKVQKRKKKKLHNEKEKNMCVQETGGRRRWWKQPKWNEPSVVNVMNVIRYPFCWSSYNLLASWEYRYLDHMGCTFQLSGGMNAETCGGTIFRVFLFTRMPVVSFHRFWHGSAGIHLLDHLILWNCCYDYDHLWNYSSPHSWFWSPAPPASFRRMTFAATWSPILPAHVPSSLLLPASFPGLWLTHSSGPGR